MIKEGMPLINYVTINADHLSIKIPDMETDIESLQRLINDLNESIGNWLDFERAQQRTCAACQVHFRSFEQHDYDLCPYCNHLYSQPKQGDLK